ncbi:hypothetical protein E4U03_00415 [Rothia nasimurium]|uniref:Uncharacterized protein n=1 Tax=Rothia nasimurium TaxID=85336 RepID=A0A4Y9F6R4_9MICC|nr:hypothetical protein [Rothia nasimurium]MBF0807091.1 hypothetical protein [Rothia nasimurium]TFU24411.1 hypothetical protein E4U03_00415 [Rothia nasimurium]
MPPAADLVDLTPRVPHEILLSLLNKPPYREKWMRHVQRRRGNSINQRAVATFIAYELSDYLDQDIDPATIKDRVSRALNGEAISDTTAHMFIAAFEFTSDEARELQRALSAHSLNRKLAQQAETLTSAERTIDTRNYTSLSTLMDGHIDRFGFMRHFVVTEIIRSEIDELTLISPRFESTDSTVTLIEGGELVSMNEHERTHIHHPDNTMWQLAIKPPAPVRYGQVHQIRYRIDLDIDPMLLEQEKCSYASLGPFTPARFNISLALTFDAEPSNMVQKIWSHTMKDESLLEVVELPSQQRYSMSFPIAEDTVFAYFWDSDYEGAIRHYHGDDPAWLSRLTPADPNS